MRIPDLRTSFPAAPLSVWADAAGAKVEELGCGMKGGGAVIPGGFWVRLVWSKHLAKLLGRKLSCLEGLAALAGCAVAIARYPGMALLVREDNQGLVHIYNKGMSSCPWTWCVAKAIADLGRATGTRIKLEKVTRCTEPGDQAADLLSKGRVDGARKKVWLEPRPDRLPRALLSWMENPVVTAGLGFRMATDLFLGRLQ